MAGCYSMSARTRTQGRVGRVRFQVPILDIAKRSTIGRLEAAPQLRLAGSISLAFEHPVMLCLPVIPSRYPYMTWQRRLEISTR